MSESTRESATIPSPKRLRFAVLRRGVFGEFRRRLAVVPTIAATILLIGCATTRVPTPPERAEVVARIEAADRRLRSMDRFEATGSAVLSIRRADGSAAEEQLDLLLLRERPGRLAVRLKLSVTDTLAWLGSDGTRWWLFLPEERPSVVWHGTVDTTEQGVTGAELGSEPMPIPPALRRPALVDLLLGLEPADSIDRLEWDAESRAWQLELPLSTAEGWSDPGWLVRRLYASDGAVVERIEIVDPRGRIVASSRLADHVRVEVPDRAVGDWPMVPMRIELSGAPDPGTNEPESVRLSLERPSGRGTRVKANAFDWQRLLKAMSPERVIVVGAEP